MKTNSFLPIMICSFCSILFMSCDKTELQKGFTEPFQIEPFTYRSDCEECPDENECCCGVELEFFDSHADIDVCGTSNGMGLCFGSDDCGSTFSGGYLDLELDTDESRKLFCMNKNSPFWIHNYHATDPAYIVITCQGDLISPQFVHIQLDPGETLYYETNGSCTIIPC